MTNPKEQLIFRLGELMLERQQNQLQIDDLFEDPQIGFYLRNIQIDSPYQQLITEGVLSQFVKGDQLVVTFTVEDYFHHVLSRIIGNQGSYDVPQALADLLLGSALRGIDEGISNLLVFDVGRGRFDRANYLIGRGGKCLDASVRALAHSLMTQPVTKVIGTLMSTASVNHWLALKRSRDLLETNNRPGAVDALNTYLVNDHALKGWILDRIDHDPASRASLVEVIGIYKGANALDAAKECYESLIAATEKADEGPERDALLCAALEHLGESEYARSGSEGYKRAMDALLRSLSIRSKYPDTPPATLAKTHRLLGMTFLSLGLQVRRAKEHLGHALEHLRMEFPATDPACLEIGKMMGLVMFWWGLRATGRWGPAAPDLLDGVHGDLFEMAAGYFEEVHGQYLKVYGKQHRKVIETRHYLQEVHYTVGAYDRAVPWLKLIQTDNFYRYALIVCLEELGLAAARGGDFDRARAGWEEAQAFATRYVPGANEISGRLSERIRRARAGIIEPVEICRPVIELEALPLYQCVKVVWRRHEGSLPWKNWQSNAFMVDNLTGINYFFSPASHELVGYDLRNLNFNQIPAGDWPASVTQIVFDQQKQVFVGWSAIRGEVHHLPRDGGRWALSGRGVHDVTACGAAYGWNDFAARPFQFGGYGFFKCKNWWWEYDDASRRWEERIENRPGVSPYPRNTQIVPSQQPNRLLLFSGCGSDTGLQREHRARGGLAWGTDVGYFTWLRDLWEIDLRTMAWRNVLPANHASIRHEGAFGINRRCQLAFNWAGSIPSPIDRKPATEVEDLSVLDLSNPLMGFRRCFFEGDTPPLAGGRLIEVPGADSVLLLHASGLWEGAIVKS
jgi:tetratricopeptide (TPR) repeat protein